jgi:carbonic anhydrase/acetyltransferase-like protein (isoleucine patch superfamily)
MAIRTYQGYSPQIGSNTFIDESAQVIGQVEIGKDSSIWPNTTIRGDVNWIKIGDCSNIQDGSVLHVTHSQPGLDKPDQVNKGFPLTIGNYVTVGHNVVLHGCSIEDYCLIGMGAIVMDDVIIEKHVFLGAGSLVAPGKRLQSGFLYLGSPARKIRPLQDDEMANFLYSAEHYIRLKNQYL